DSGDRSRLIANVLNFKGSYADDVRARFGALQLSDVAGGRVAWSVHVAAQDYANTWRFGPIRSAQAEHHALARAEATWTAARQRWTFDPRAALAWKPDARQTVRLSSGRYHQLPATRFLDPVYGNPALGPLSADHLIAGYEWSAEPVTARVEAYRKVYRGLVTND